MGKVVTLGIPAAVLLAMAGDDWLSNPAEPKAWAVISAFVALVLLMALYVSLFGEAPKGEGEGGDQ